MLIKKHSFFAILSTVLTFCLCSCIEYQIRQDLVDFTDNFDISKCVKEYPQGHLNFETFVYKDDVEFASYTIEYNFSIKDDSNYFSHKVTNYYGNYIEDGLIKEESKIIKIENSDKYNQTIIKTYENKPEEITNDELESFRAYQTIAQFYGVNDNGIWSNGLYYGDALKKTLFNHQNFMTINVEENTLTLDIKENYIPESDTAVQYDLTVNQYGMLLNYSSFMRNNLKENLDQPQTKTTTKILVNYE